MYCVNIRLNPEAIGAFGLNLRLISFGLYARPSLASNRQFWRIQWPKNNGRTKTRWNCTETVKYSKNTKLIKKGNNVRRRFLSLLLFLCPK